MRAVENDVPRPETDVPSAADRSVQRILGPRSSAYREEVQRLLTAGLQEIADKGSVEPRVADIVRRAGLSNKAFYRHFRSKDELILAILEEGMRARVAQFETLLAEADSAVARVRTWLRAVTEQAINPVLADLSRPMMVYQARIAESMGPQLWKHRDYLLAPLERALEEGLGNGELPDVDPYRDARFLYFLSMGWMHGKVIERIVPGQEEADELVEFAMRALDRSRSA